jgi:hypothetical protein
MQRRRSIWFTALPATLALTAGIANAAAPTATAPVGIFTGDVGLSDGTHKGSGSTTVSGTGTAAVYTVTAIGQDITGNKDRGYFVYTNLPADGGITARVLTQTGGSTGGWMKNGVMIRDTVDPGSVMAAINYTGVGTNNKNAEIEWLIRSKANTGPAEGSVNRDLKTGPVWLRVQRQGTTVQVLSSDNGKDWALRAQGTLPITATQAVLVGLDASSQSDTVAEMGTHDTVSTSAEIVQPNPPAGPSLVEVTPGSGEVLLTYRTMPDVVGYNIYRQEAGSTAAPTKLTQQPTANGWYLDSSVTNGTNYLYTVTAVTKSLADPTQMLEGAPSAAVLATPQAPVQVAAGSLTSFDIGTTTPGTTALDNNGVLTITASGADIWNASDSFRLVGGGMTGDYSIQAKLLAKPAPGPKNTSTWVKAGVMIRESLDPAAREAWMVSTSGNGVQFGYRNVYNSSDSKALVGVAGTSNAKTTYPIFLMLSRSGDNISGFQSSDGITWTQVGTAASFPSLSADTNTGLAATAHTSDQKSSDLLGSATFEAASVQINP